MEYRQLGQAGIKLSSVSLGGWVNYGESKIPTAEAEKVIVAAYEAGINFFDIADVYERGEAEKQMGTVLKKFPRHTLVISSKVYWPMSDDVNDRGLSRKHIMESVEKSLKRIGTDYLDIYYCHRADSETPLLETARAMDDLVHQGKVLYWGTSEWPGQKIADVCALCTAHNLYLPQTEQSNYSMLRRERVENDILPVTVKNGMGLIVFSPLAQGMLTGKYDNGIVAGTRFAREDWAAKEVFTADNAAKVQGLKSIAESLGISRSQLALAWALRHPSVSTVITGATKAEQLQENVRAAEVKLGDEVIAQIEKVLAQTAMTNV